MRHITFIFYIFIFAFVVGCGGGSSSSSGSESDSSKPDNSDTSDTTDEQNPTQDWEIVHTVTDTDANGDTGYFNRGNWDMGVRGDGTVLVAWEFILDSVINTPTDINAVRYTPGGGWSTPQSILQNVGDTVNGTHMRTSIGDAQSETLALRRHGTFYRIYEHTPNNGIWNEVGIYDLSGRHGPRISESPSGSLFMSAPRSNNGGIFGMQVYYSHGSVTDTNLESVYTISYAPGSDVDQEMLNDNIHLDENGTLHAVYPVNREPQSYQPRPSDDPVPLYSQALLYRKRDKETGWHDSVELAITESAVNTEVILLQYDSAVSSDGRHGVVVWIEKQVQEKEAISQYNIYVQAMHDGIWNDPVSLYTSEEKYSYSHTTAKAGIDVNGNTLIAFTPSDLAGGTLQIEDSAKLFAFVYTVDNASWSQMVDLSTVYSKRLTEMSLQVVSPPGAGHIKIVTKELVGYPDRATQGTQKNSVTDYLISRSFDPEKQLIEKKEIMRKNYEVTGYSNHKGINDNWKTKMDAEGNTYVLWAYDKNPSQYSLDPIRELNVSRLAAP